MYKVIADNDLTCKNVAPELFETEEEAKTWAKVNKLYYHSVAEDNYNALPIALERLNDSYKSMRRFAGWFIAIAIIFSLALLIAGISFCCDRNELIGTILLICFPVTLITLLFKAASCRHKAAAALYMLKQLQLQEQNK